MAKRTRAIIISLQQLVEEFELVGFPVTKRWINNLAKHKKLPRVKRGEYDLLECLRWLIRYQQELHSDDLTKFKSREEHEARKAKYQADLLEIKVNKTKEIFIAKASVIKILASYLSILDKTLKTIPKRVAYGSGAKDIEPKIREQIDIIRRDILTIPERLRDSNRFRRSVEHPMAGNIQRSTETDGESMGGRE